MNATLQGNLAGIFALLMWSAMIGLIRSITDAFGVAAGTALIYSAGALALFLKNGIPKVRGMPRTYVFGVGALFLCYEMVFSRAIALAGSPRQTLEVGMLNYLWPCLTVIFSIWIRKTRLRRLVWPGTALAAAGLCWCVAANNGLDLDGFLHNFRTTPLPYILGMTAAVTWALYNNFSALCSKGENAVAAFFAAIAVVLWAVFFIQGNVLQFPGWKALGQLALAGVIVGFSYSLWETGIHNGNFLFLAVCSYFTPAASMLFTSLWLNVLPPAGFWGGVGLVIAGSLLCWLAGVKKHGLPRGAVRR